MTDFKDGLDENKKSKQDTVDSLDNAYALAEDQEEIGLKRVDIEVYDLVRKCHRCGVQRRVTVNREAHIRTKEGMSYKEAFPDLDECQRLAIKVGLCRNCCRDSDNSDLKYERDENGNVTDPPPQQSGDNIL